MQTSYVCVTPLAAARLALLRVRRVRPQAGAPLHVRRVLRRAQVGFGFAQIIRTSHIDISLAS